MTEHRDEHTAGADWTTLFEELPIGAYRSTPEGHMLRANRALVAFNGYATEAQLIAAVHSIEEDWYVDRLQRKRFRQALERDGRVVGMISQVYRHQTRELAWVSENAHRVLDSAGRTRFFEGTVEDITTRMQAQQALERNDALFAVLARQLPGVMFLESVASDGSTRFQFVSEGVRELYGLDPADVLEDGAAMRRLRHPDDWNKVQTGLTQARHQASGHQDEFRIVRPDGQLRWVRASSTPVPGDAAGGLRCGLVIDVTAQHEADELRHARDRAQAAHQAIAALLARISHELRTPLNAVLGFSQLLAIDATLAAKPQRYAEEALRAGRHLLLLVDDLLDLGRAESGKITLRTLDLDPTAALQESARLIEALCRELGVMLELPAPPLPAVHADPERLRQILTNLLSNAVKYNRAGGWVRVQVLPRGDKVVLQVSDSGPGLDAGQRARLFQPFERLGAERSTVPGTGLGLALSRQIARAMGGEIDVQSQPGEGCCFTLTLPAAAGTNGG